MLLIEERIFIRELPASEVCIDSTSRTFSTYSSLDAGIPNGTSVEDCAGECGGDAVVDDCGVCDGDGSSCEVYIELEITTTLDEPIVDDEELEEFEEDFESYMETELGLPEGTVEVTNIEFSEVREVEVTIELR